METREARLDLVASRREGFLESRKIGGSSCGTILCMRKWTEESIFKTPMELALELKGLSEREDPGVPAEIGTRLEPMLLRIYEEEFGAHPVQVEHQIENPDFPYSTANVDGLFIEETGGERVIVGILEVKTTSKRLRKEPPVGYEFQLKHYRAVLHNQDWVTINGEKLRVAKDLRLILFMMEMGRGYPTRRYIVESDDEESLFILRTEEAFWKEYVEGDAVPDVTVLDSPGTIDRFFEKKTETLELGQDGEDLLDRYLSLKEEEGRIKKEIALMRNQILAMMEGFETGSSGSLEVTCKKGADRKVLSLNKVLEEYPVLKRAFDEKGLFAETKSGALRITVKRKDYNR